MPKKYKLIKANRDPEVQIKETDADFVHVRHTRIIPDETGKHPETQHRIQVYTKEDWKGMERWIEKHGVAALNDDEVKVIHDPEWSDKKAEEEAAKQKEKEEKTAALAKDEKKEKERIAIIEKREKILGLLQQGDVQTAKRLLKDLPAKAVTAKIKNALEKAEEKPKE